MTTTYPPCDGSLHGDGSHLPSPLGGRTKREVKLPAGTWQFLYAHAAIPGQGSQS